MGTVTVPVGRTLTPAYHAKSRLAAAVPVVRTPMRVARVTTSLPEPAGFIRPTIGVPPAPPVKPVGLMPVAIV